MDIGERKLQKRLQKAIEANKLEDLELCYRRLAEYKASLGHYEDALQYYKDELAVAEKTGSARSIAGAHRMIGEMCSTLGKCEESLVHVNEYLSYAACEGDVIEEQRALATIGRTYFCWAVEIQQDVPYKCDSAKLKDVLNRCRKAYTDSLKICETKLKNIDFKERQEMKARLLFNLGLACEVEDNLKQAFNYIDQAVNICQKETLLEDLFRCRISQGTIFLKQGNTVEALSAIDKALLVAKRLPNSVESTVLALTNKAEINFSLGNYSGAQSALKQAYKLKTPNEEDKKTVETQLKRAIFLCSIESKLVDLPLEDIVERKSLYEKMGDACCSIKNYQHAIQCYHNMLECCEKLGSSDKDLRPCYVSLCQTYRDNKQYNLALLYAKKELEISNGIPEENARTHIGIGDILDLDNASFDEISDHYRAALKFAKEASNVALEVSALRRLEAIQRSHGYLELAKESKKSLDKLGRVDSDSSDGEIEDSPSNIVHLSDLSDSEDDKKRPRPCRNSVRVTKNEKGETPLHVAAIRGDEVRAKRLITIGHPVKERDVAGWTPLHEAANHGHLELVKMFFEAGADVNDPGGKECGGVTALHDATSNGHFSIAHYLLDHGASVSVLTDTNETPLDSLKAWKGRVEMSTDDFQEYSELVKRLEEALTATGFTKMTKNEPSLNSSFLGRSPIVKSETDKTLNRSRRHEASKKSERMHSRKDIDWDNPSSRWRSASPESFPFDIEVSPEKVQRDVFDVPPPKKSVIDYKATMQALRKRPVPSEVLKPKIDAPLVNEEDYVDEWLEDDLGLGRSEKKAKRKVVDWIDRDKMRIGKQINESRFFPSHSEDELDDRLSETNSQIRKKPKIQSYDAGFDCRVETPSYENIELINLESTPLPPSPPVSSVSDHATTLKLRVNVEQHTLLIAVDSLKADELTVQWLIEEAAKRYFALENIEPRLTLKTKDGAILTATDPLTVALGEELESTILSWKIGRLPERYRDACLTHSSDSQSAYGAYICGPDIVVEARLESCVTSRMLDLSYLALLPDELKPVFIALKLEKSLQSLDISGNVVCDSGVELLTQCLRHCSIQNINLRCTNISSAGFNHLCQELDNLGEEKLSFLQSIELSYNPWHQHEIKKPPAWLVSRLIGFSLPGEVQ